MKLVLGLLLCLLHNSQCSQWESGKSIPIHHKERRNHNSQPRDECIVSNFKEVQRIEPKKLIGGDWYESYRTATSIPVFSSGVWRFQATSNPEVLTFLFAAKLKNGKCMDSVSGEVLVPSNETGKLILKYDGLKGRVEEQFKVLQTDYTTKAILYGCRYVVPTTGECPTNATFLVILSRYRSLSQDVAENLRENAKEVCLDSASLHHQDGIVACNLDHQDPHQWKDSINGGVWPVCRTPSPCTLACPPCCTEGEDGCIHCNCGSDPKPSQVKSEKMSEECVTSLSFCHGSLCQLKEVRQGCLACDCLPVMQAPPAPIGNVNPGAAAPAISPGTNLYDITDIRECPTTCRIGHENFKMVCNCTNSDLCRPVPPGVPHSCSGTEEERYYFDHKTGTCHAFFGSCLTTKSNNFHSLKECIATCADVCELPLDIGMCKDPVQNKRYYHNRVTGECDTFMFGGCGGNDNNFETQELCNHKCPAKMEGIDRHKDLKAICRQPSEKGHCTKSLVRYFYLSITKTCTSFFYSGCGGNENNFNTAEECLHQCLGIQEQNNPHSCMEMTDCSCPLTTDEVGCPTCPCLPDGANGLQISLALFMVGTFLSAKAAFIEA